MESTSSKLSSTFFLLQIFIISSFIYPTSAARNPLRSKTNNDFIKTSCSETTYPRLCFASLSTHASTIQTSPKLLAGAALNVTLSSAKSASALMLKLSKIHGISPKGAAAMKDCMEELSDSVDELRNSIAEMSKLRTPSFNLVMNDIQTWVSAALTDENTCSDGFAEEKIKGNLTSIVKGRVLNVAQLTSNALALINKYALLHA